MPQVTQEEATAKLPELIDEAARSGEEVVILRGNIAVARIVPVTENAQRPVGKRQFGSARGLIRMAEDFDAPLDDFKEYM